jgi:response regulator of citrate/malate metabolism
LRLRVLLLSQCFGQEYEAKINNSKFDTLVRHHDIKEEAKKLKKSLNEQTKTTLKSTISKENASASDIKKYPEETTESKH